ncbi:beta-N-acetylhexosaminidase [Carboxylicivirga sediminis]|uniref:beta-N-acetylhexosaminidase n=1 Tax=Carboxylicivirga sediminis TaxID=2006564 RepID=A0A941F4W7_9BACT|nr:beta-N-acetylhexosaminidase [Carboxylicivirga sediminis]MBR8535280.1 beta-N-acetylhexosaminidase [Carboxylicivirga sediminis]
MKKNVMASIAAIVLMQLSVSCQKPIPTDLSKINLIPAPVHLNATGSSFQLNESTNIYVTEGNEALRRVAQVLAGEVESVTGLKLHVSEVPELPVKGISLTVGSANKELGSEGYKLSVNERLVALTANEVEGVFRGVQSLVQMLGVNGKMQEHWLIPSGDITDYPQYAYRGMMLDVARHFFSVDDVKRVIDLAAIYKLNVLHLHLTDDQGWRIEIKSWPKLTTIGGSTEVGGGEGGFYTQEDYKEIVRYASQRYITIVPEIDMPGHTNAAVVAYPELNGNGMKAELYTGTEVGFSTLATQKEVTYQFVDDVIRELAAITDGPYIHIGGDESHVTKEKDYVYFINRAKDIVKKYNKTMIGWDEIAHANVDDTDIVQYWAKDANAKLGVKKGAKVLMSPSKRTYLDMKYDSTSHIGLDWAALIEVEQSYNWTLETLVDGIGKENILGIESPLWTETVETMDDIEYLVFPRLIGHAEIGWSPVNHLNWENYKQRLAEHGNFLHNLEVNFYQSSQVTWEIE